MGKLDICVLRLDPLAPMTGRVLLILPGQVKNLFSHAKLYTAQGQSF